MIKLSIRQRGFVTYWMLGVSLFVGLIGLTMIQSVGWFQRNLVDTEAYSRAQDEAENIARGAISLIRDARSVGADMTKENIDVLLADQLATYLSSGSVLDSVDVRTDAPVVTTIASGPFAGIQTESQRVALRVRTLKNNVAGEISVNLDLGKIYPTQFSIFGYKGVILPSYGTQVSVGSKVFANEGILVDAMNSSKVTSLESVITAAKIVGANYRIANRSNPSLPEHYTSVSTPMASLLSAQNCTNCDNSGLEYRGWISTVWNGQYRDSTLGVIPLNGQYLGRITIRSVGGSTNTSIIYPGGPAGPLLRMPTADRQLDKTEHQSLAYEADIRIINGVWYLKNPSSPHSWPGIPVWSDHPGRMRTWNEENLEGTRDVGQLDIRDRLAAQSASTAWPANSVPEFYSYYRFDPNTNRLLSNTNRAVISYGNLKRTTSSGVGNWIPGDYVGNFLCQPGETCTNCSNPNYNIQSPSDFTPICQNSSGVITASPSLSTRLLNGTRGGFRHGALQMRSYYQEPTSKMWPMNFDVKQFERALRCDAHPGEIGCYFGTGRLIPRPFNGVIYVINTWPTMLRGFEMPGAVIGVSSPFREWPFMQKDTQQNPLYSVGSTNFDPAQADAAPGSAGANSYLQNGILPMQVCSDSLGGQPADASGRFTIPSCTSYQINQFIGRINSLRLINGNFDPSGLPRGLTVFHPSETFVVGDLNTNSDTSSATATPWVPVLVASTNVVPLSNAWSDDLARWDVSTQNFTRTASDTRQNFSMTVTPHRYPASAGNDLRSFIDFNEDWRTAQYQQVGSLIFGAEVFSDKTNPQGTIDIGQRFHRHICYQLTVTSSAGTWVQVPRPAACVNSIYEEGPRNFYSPATLSVNMDPHSKFSTKQPPGLPAMPITLINTWIKKTRETAASN